MRFPLSLPLRRRGLERALALTFVGLTLAGCGPEAPATDASTAVGPALEHARKHSDPAYVCPMHPQVVSPEPGRCPICGMDLVAREAEAAEADPQAAAGADEVPAISVSDAVVNQLGVRTAAVRRGTLDLEVQGFGTFARSAGTSNLLVVAQVFEREAPLLRQGQAARVRLPSLGSREWSGTVTSIETQINPSTHTLQFRLSVDSEGVPVPAGTTALVTVRVDKVMDALLVPREAVIVTGKGARVVVAQGGGRFQPRAVEAEDLGAEEIVVRKGLSEGEQVVVSAQFLLDSEANLQAGLKRLSGGLASAQPAPEGTPHEGHMHEGHMHEGAMQEEQMHQGHAPDEAVHQGHTHEAGDPSPGEATQEEAMREPGAEGAAHGGTLHQGSMEEGPAAGGTTK